MEIIESHFPDEQKEKLYETYESILSIDDQWTRLQEITDLAPQLSKDQIERAFKTIVVDSPDIQINVDGINKLASYIDKEVIQDLYMKAHTFQNNHDRAIFLGTLAPYLSEDMRKNIIRDLNSFGDKNTRLNAWIRMAEFLPANLKHEALETAVNLSDEYQKAEAFIALAPHISDVWKLKILESVQSISMADIRVRVLATLAQVLPDRERGRALNDALKAFQFISDPVIAAESYILLIPLVPNEIQEKILSKAFNVANEIENPSMQAWALIDLGEFLEGDKKYAIYQQALRTILKLELEEDLVEQIFHMVLRLPPEMVPFIRKVVNEIPNPDWRISVINRIDGILLRKTLDNEKIEEKVTIPTKNIIQEQLNDEQVEEKEAKTIESPPARGKTKKTKNGKKVKSNKTSPKTKILTEPELSEDGKQIATYLHSDKWTLDDQLNYSLYAKSLAEFIYHQNTTPPMTTVILAPWGQGKTTLMRLVQYQLWRKIINEKLNNEESKVLTMKYVKENGLKIQEIKYAGSDKEEIKEEVEDSDNTKEVYINKHIQKPQKRPTATFKAFLDWLQDLSSKVDQDEASTKLDANIKPKKLEYPTVWFNAWKYQSNEQIWAGMAHAIISQLVEQIPDTLEREKFWLALQAERLDFNAIRNDIHKAVLEKFLPRILIWSIVSLIGLLVSVVGIISTVIFDKWIVWGISTSGIVTFFSGIIPIIKKWLNAKAEVNEAPLGGKFAQYVRQPNYEDKLGFFHEVEHDVRRVFDLLVTPDKPAVVFIDDLDRCSPGMVAKVIEAVNLFLSGDFPNCYFVIGVDAQVVAASMEVAHEKLTERLKNVTRNYGSLGWYFMDKFIQLQFMIPNMTPCQRTGFLGQLFQQEFETKNGHEQNEPKSDKDAEKIINDAFEKSMDPDQIIKQSAHALNYLRRKGTQSYKNFGNHFIELGAQKYADNDPNILKYLKQYETYLGTSPRTMKRFANLYRFYGLTQLSRKIQDLSHTAPSALAPWLVIMLRWPQLVRWIQWEGETRLAGSGASPLERANAISEKVKGADTYEEWLKELNNLGASNITWLADREMYTFLNDHAEGSKQLSCAVEAGVW